MTEPQQSTRKPFERRYKSVVPIPRPKGVDDYPESFEGEGHPDFILARWLGRESVERVAASDRLEVVDYHDRVIPLDEVDPRLGELLGKPVDAFVWFEFVGLGRLNMALFDWFAAEFRWNCEQWLQAEDAYLAEVDAGGA